MFRVLYSRRSMPVYSLRYVRQLDKVTQGSIYMGTEGLLSRPNEDSQRRTRVNWSHTKSGGDFTKLTRTDFGINGVLSKILDTWSLPLPLISLKINKQTGK